MTAEHVGLFVAGQTQLKVSRRIGRREREDRAGGRTDEDRLFNDVDGDRRESDVERHVEEKMNPLHLAWHTIIFTECDHLNYSLDEQLELCDKKKLQKRNLESRQRVTVALKSLSKIHR